MCTWVSSGPAYLMICSMSPPWWNVCGAQYRNDTQSLSMPRTRSTPARPSSTKSSGCGSSTSRIPSPSKTGAGSSSERQNWAPPAARAPGGPPERALAGRRRLGAPVELGVHHGRAEVHGDLDGPLPVADRRLAFGLVRAGPPVQGQHRGDFYAGRIQGLGELRDLGPAGPRVGEERQEVLARGQLDAGVAEVRDEPGEFGQRN